MSRDVPDDAYFEADCPVHGRTTFVDLMGDDFCVQCLADTKEPAEALSAPQGKETK